MQAESSYWFHTCPTSTAGGDLRASLEGLWSESFPAFAALGPGDRWTSPDTTAIYCTQGGTVAGALLLQRVAPGSHTIRSLAVRPGHRGIGIGRELLARATSLHLGRSSTYAGGGLFLYVNAPALEERAYAAAGLDPPGRQALLKHEQFLLSWYAGMGFSEDHDAEWAEFIGLSCGPDEHLLVYSAPPRPTNPLPPRHRPAAGLKGLLQRVLGAGLSCTAQGAEPP